MTAVTEATPKKESSFLKVADYVSAAMGRPTNIMIWLIAVVAAASNRSERNLETTLARLSQQDQQIADVETELSDSLAQNTTLTNQLKELAAQNIELTRSVESLAREVHAVVCARAAGNH